MSNSVLVPDLLDLILHLSPSKYTKTNYCIKANCFETHVREKHSMQGLKFLCVILAL